jgi:hypothetical protein
MKRIRYAAVLMLALLALSFGRASALSVTVAPPQGTIGSSIACPAQANLVAGTNGLWTVTDAKCLSGLLSTGWTVTQAAQVLTPAANVVMDLSKGCAGSIAFPAAGQNVSLTATNISYCAGKPVYVYTLQPASGTTNNTLTLSTGFTLNTAAPAVQTGTSASDVLEFYDNGTVLTYPVGGSAGAFGTTVNTATLNLGTAGATQGKLTIAGSASGVITIGNNPTAVGTYNWNFPITAGAVGAILTSGGGTTAAEVWLADAAAGQVLTSAGTTTIPAFSASPSITSATLAGTADKSLLLSNGGHLSSLLGTGAAVTSGTGSVTTGSTDNAGEVTGCTSACTVTFGVAWAAKPMCVCNDITSATGVCKIVPNANGLTAVVTTAGTDSFEFICIGK